MQSLKITELIKKLWQGTEITWFLILSLIFLLKPPFYPQFFTMNTQIVSTFDIIIDAHISGDPYVKQSGFQQYSSNAYIKKIG